MSTSGRSTGWGARRKELAKTRLVCAGLSGASLNEEALLSTAFEMMKARPIEASLLRFEVAESATLSNPLGLSLIGERSKDVEMARRLGACGFDGAQGYAISLPAEMPERLRAASSADCASDPATVKLLRELKSGRPRPV